MVSDQMAMSTLIRGIVPPMRPLRLLPPCLLALIGLAAAAWCGAALRQHSAEAQSLHIVYTAASLAGRDPDAAMRRARYTTTLFMHEFNMSRADASAEVARFTITRGQSICGGG